MCRVEQIINNEFWDNNINLITTKAYGLDRHLITILALGSMKEFVKISMNAKIFLVVTAFFVIISMGVFFK